MEQNIKCFRGNRLTEEIGKFIVEELKKNGTAPSLSSLANQFGVKEDTIRYKLKSLLMDGIISSHKEGTKVVYSLPDKKDVIHSKDKSIYQSVKIGDSILYQTSKSCDIDGSMRSYGSCDRYATVIAKYPKFALVVLPSGVKDSVNWMDVKKIKKAKKPGGTSHGKEL